MVVSIKGKPVRPAPTCLLRNLSWQPPPTPGRIIGGLAPLSQFRPRLRSMYQPSCSMCMLSGLQASGDDSIRTEVFTCRAVNPNISLRSPVSVAVITLVITPPRCDGPLTLAAGAAVDPSESPDSMGVIMYF